MLEALVVMTVLGTVVELVRKHALKKHGMTLTEYYEKKARGEKVPDL
jgi:hypothetical protein